MKHILSIYLKVAQKRRKKYDLTVDNFSIENWDSIDPDARDQYYIEGYGKKQNRLFKGYFDAHAMIGISNQIQKSSLVIVKSKRFCRNNALNMLREYSYKERCFAPIVYFGGEDILFFPQLRYQDGLLIRWLLKQQFENEVYHVAYANRTKLVID